MCIIDGSPLFTQERLYNKQWVVATVTVVHPDGTFDALFQDGDTGHHLSMKQESVRKMKAKRDRKQKQPFVVDYAAPQSGSSPQKKKAAEGAGGAAGQGMEEQLDAGVATADGGAAAAKGPDNTLD